MPGMAMDKMPASESQNQAVECEPVTGSGLYLDKDILDRWATERGDVLKGKDIHSAVAEWFYARIGRQPVELVTRQDVLAFKDKLLLEGQSVANTNTKLSRLRTLLGSGLVDHSQKMTVAARATAEKKAVGQRS